MQISRRHAPNTLAFAYTLDSGTVFTLYHSTPGETAPRMQMQVAGGSPVDCGPVDDPARFGPYRTPAEFEEWVRRFAEQA